MSYFLSVHLLHKYHNDFAINGVIGSVVLSNGVFIFNFSRLELKDFTTQTLWMEKFGSSILRKTTDVYSVEVRPTLFIHGVVPTRKDLLAVIREEPAIGEIGKIRYEWA